MNSTTTTNFLFPLLAGLACHFKEVIFTVFYVGKNQNQCKQSAALHHTLLTYQSTLKKKDTLTDRNLVFCTSMVKKDHTHNCASPVPSA